MQAIWVEPGTAQPVTMLPRPAEGSGATSLSLGGRYASEDGVSLQAEGTRRAAVPHLPLVVPAMDLHKVLLHLHGQVLRREVFHVQEDDELVTVGSDLKPICSCGSLGATARGARELAVVPAGQAGGPAWRTDTERSLGSPPKPLLPYGVPGAPDSGLRGHSADHQNLGTQGGAAADTWLVMV